MMPAGIIFNLEITTWIKDTNFKFISCSESIAEAAGVESPRKMIGKTDFDFTWRNNAANFQKGDAISFSGNVYKNIELLNTCDGTIKVFATKNPLYNQNNQIIGSIGSFIDISNLWLAQKNWEFNSDGTLFLGAGFGNTCLTRREVEILKFILLGYSSKKMGLILLISHRTVEGYIGNIKRKLQCKTKGDIVVLAIKSGLIFLIETMNKHV